MRPRRLVGASGRPLNFTVRSHFRGLTHREEQGTPSLGIAVYQVHLTMLSYGRLRLTPRYARAAFSLSIERGARAERKVALGHLFVAIRRTEAIWVPTEGGGNVHGVVGS